MRLRLLLGLTTTALLGGCQACSDCTDYAPPAAFTAPGEIYAGGVLPGGLPVAPRGVSPPSPPDSEPMPTTPDQAPAAPMAARQ